MQLLQRTISYLVVYIAFPFCIKVMPCVSSPFLLYLSKRVLKFIQGVFSDHHWSSPLIWPFFILFVGQSWSLAKKNQTCLLLLMRSLYSLFFSSWFIMLYFLVQCSGTSIFCLLSWQLFVTLLIWWRYECGFYSAQLKLQKWNVLTPSSFWYSGYIGMYTDDWILFFKYVSWHGFPITPCRMEWE